MAQVPHTDVFFEKLKKRFLSLGFQEKLATTVASLIEPVKLDGNTLIADCKNGFYRDTVIKPQMAEISEIAKECWGAQVEFFIRSEPENTAPAPKRRQKSSPRAQDLANAGNSLFDLGHKPTVSPVPVTPAPSSPLRSTSAKNQPTAATGQTASSQPAAHDGVASAGWYEAGGGGGSGLTQASPVEAASGGNSKTSRHPVAHKTAAKSTKVTGALAAHSSAGTLFANQPGSGNGTSSAGGGSASGTSGGTLGGGFSGIALGEEFEGHTPVRTLIPELTFGTFVRGQSNLVAYSACEAIARNPGNLTNPVFIYGATGLGKTHLLHSVGNEIQRHHPDWQILYVTSGDFMTELIASIRFSKQESFRNKYRQCDVLLVDDIQFLENKDTTQLEFFHTFNELYQKKKQIVITSDKYPKDIPNIEERLKSRFLQGLIADIEPPSFEDRVAIIEAKAKMLGLALTNEVILQISTHVKSNVREIQGVLNNLLMTQSMTGQAPTIESTNALLKRVVRMQGSALDVHMIQKAVAGHFGIKISELMSQNRSQKFVVPRHIAMYLAKELMDSATTEIAEAFGKKDHTTVMHAISKVKELLEKDASTRAVVNELKRKLDQNLP